MKHLVVAALVVSLLASSAAARHWTGRNAGFSVDAELVDVTDGNAVLKKEDGSTVSVPLNKLSLGDIRYIHETLKALEGEITNEKPDEQGGDAAADVAGEDVKAAAGVDLKKLQYQWKEGDTYVYRVKISGDRGYYADYYAGNVTYRVKSVEGNNVVLGMTADMTRGENNVPIDVFVTVLPHGVVVHSQNVRIASSKEKVKEVTVTTDSLGHVEDLDGTAQLPYLLGDLSQLMLETLPETPKSSWTISEDSGLWVVSTSYPYYRFWGTRFHDDSPAGEKTTYSVQGEKGKLITLTKQYELATTSKIDGMPRFEVSGSGKMAFDTERGLPASMDMRLRIFVREMNRTDEVPVRVTYKLLSEQEVVLAAKEAEEAKKNADAARKEKLRPLTDEEIDSILEVLASGDDGAMVEKLKMLAEKTPRELNPKIAKALEAILLNAGVQAPSRAEAANAMKNWGTAENVPALLRALNDEWPPVRCGAIEALIRFKPHEAIKPVALSLGDTFTRGPAEKFLKAVGADAEDAVLPALEEKDDWARASAAEILGVIGTNKSVPALEKALTDESWMVNGNARKALVAIKKRHP